MVLNYHSQYSMNEKFVTTLAEERSQKHWKLIYFIFFSTQKPFEGLKKSVKNSVSLKNFKPWDLLPHVEFQVLKRALKTEDRKRKLITFDFFFTTLIFFSNSYNLNESCYFPLQNEKQKLVQSSDFNLFYRTPRKKVYSEIYCHSILWRKKGRSN